MKVGFTGTRHGMSEMQSRSLGSLLLQLEPTEFHHGSCMGSDVAAAKMVRSLFPKCWIVAHPGPDGDSCRRVSGVDNETLPGMNHHARNRDIVFACDVLVGTPQEDEPQPRGGTWYTLGFGDDARKTPVVIWGDGRRSMYHEPTATPSAR